MKNRQIDNIKLSFQEIWKFDKRLIFLLIADVIICALKPFPNIVFAGRIVDALDGGNDFYRVVSCVSMMFGLDILFTLLSMLLSNSQKMMLTKLRNKMNNDLNEKCLSIDFEKINDTSFQSRIASVNSEVQGNNFYTSLSTLFSTLSAFITLIGIVAVMTTLNIWLLLLALIIILLQAVLHYIRLRLDKRYHDDTVYDQQKNRYVSELPKNLQAKKDIVTYNMGDYIMRKAVEYQQTMFGYQKRRVRENSIIETATYLLSMIFRIGAYLLLGIKVFTGDITIGEFTTGITSLVNFMSSTSYITNNIIAINHNTIYIRSYKAFMKLRSKFDDKKEKVSLSDVDLDNFELEFRNVSFRYPSSTSYVLKNINLTIHSGEKLAVVGYNGAGKTTFALLLTRMYDPTEGAIYLNGVDIRNIKYHDYQKIFSTVNQDFSLLAFSLLENIAITDEVSVGERNVIMNLMKENGLENRMKKLYKGLDTPVTKRLSAAGVDLSGGESQKVAIVRAQYKNAPVLVLDEPTAALDPQAEFEMFQKFAEMAQKKTTVMISHRIYSTRFCDKIVVFDKGIIMEYGTFDELMERKGLYYDFFEKQAEYFK